ncbi:MAG: hypothetical protein FWH41_03035 [Treponema sp.]|nr:hypothetical protein [Treponema sp.]
MMEIPRTFYIYCRNEYAELEGPKPVNGSDLEYINDPMLALATEFADRKITITGKFKSVVAIDSLCIGNTNAISYELHLGPHCISGSIEGIITVYNFDATVFTDSFSLELNGLDPLFLGHLFFGQRTCLPRFAPEAEGGIMLTSEGSRSFGGQAFGIRRITLENFSVNFPRLSAEEREIIVEYVQSVLNVEPHVIDPYPQARDYFPPRYVTLNTGEISLPRRNENGFYYSGSLSWQEAR